MPIPTHTLTLKVYQPDNKTLIEGSWRLWLETEDGIAINDAGDGIAGEDLVRTVSGTATKALPDTTDAGFDPQGAFYRGLFTSTDHSVRIMSEPFLMDADKTLADIMVVTDIPVTPSALAQVIAARDAAIAARDAAIEAAASIEAEFAAITAHLTDYDNPHQVTKEQLALGNVDNTADMDKPLSGPQAAAIEAILAGVAHARALVEDPTDPGTYLIVTPSLFAEDSGDEGTYLTPIPDLFPEDNADVGTYLIGA